MLLCGVTYSHVLGAETLPEAVDGECTVKGQFKGCSVLRWVACQGW